jgi:phenylacetate-coenzyme A ligase PaaK-like adenylate-forming protein
MQAFAKALKRLSVGDAVVRRNPLFYPEARDAIAELLRGDFNARKQWTEKRIAETLWTARRSRYARKVDGGSKLQSWPILHKEQVRNDPQAFQCSSSWLVAKASTGGTSGAPLQLSRSLRAIAFEQACIDQMIAMLGAEARSAKCAILRTDAIKDPNDFRPPFWIEAGGGQRLIFSCSHLNAQTMSAYVEALERFAPDVLWAYPTSLEALCMLLERGKLKLHLPRVMCSSEVLHAPVWDLAIRQLNCSLLDYYGQAERVAFAYATARGEYRFLPGYAHLEFRRVGAEGDLATYEIIGTSLWNSAMPLIRYATGDLIRLPMNWGSRELDELAMGTRTFAGVLGRDSDILITPEGVKVTGISHFQRDVNNIVRIQVIQETSSAVLIRVLAKPGFGIRDQEALLQNVRTKLPSTMQVRIDLTEPLERTTLGKTPFVIHRPAVKEQLREMQMQRGTA